MHVYLDNVPPKLVHSLVSDPGGGGLLHLASEQKVTRLGKSFKTFWKLFENRLQRSIFQEKFVLKGYSPKAISIILCFLDWISFPFFPPPVVTVVWTATNPFLTTSVFSVRWRQFSRDLLPRYKKDSKNNDKGYKLMDKQLVGMAQFTKEEKGEW